MKCTLLSDPAAERAGCTRKAVKRVNRTASFGYLRAFGACAACLAFERESQRQQAESHRRASEHRRALIEKYGSLSEAARAGESWNVQ